VGISPRVDDFDAELMAEDSRIIEKRLIPGEGVKIGPTDADTMNSDESLTNRGKRFGCVGGGELAGLIERDLEHVWNVLKRGAWAGRDSNL